MIIIASVATASGMGAVGYIKFNNAKAQFQTMQSQVNSWYEQSKNNADVLNYGTTDLSGLDVTKVSNTLYDDETGIAEVGEYRYFSSEYIQDILDIDGISYDFFIDIKDRSVLLYGGITYQDYTYYSAEDFGINTIKYQEMTGTITFDTSIEYRTDDTYIIVSNISIPEGISKYEVKYQVDGYGYWKTLTADMKDELGLWRVPVTIGQTYNIKITTASDGIEEKVDSRKIPTQIEFLVDKGDKVTEKLTLTDENGDSITIPKGFYLASDSSTQVKDGIVVVAPDGSEFVWVPVEDISTMYGTNSSGVKLGKMYAFNNDGTVSARGWKETDGVMIWTSANGYKEPDILTDTEYGDASTTEDRGINLLSSIVKIEGDTSTEEGQKQILNTWQNQLQNEFDEMIKYVGENKGFYVGRYETSLREIVNEDETTKIAQSKCEAQSATASSSSANTWYGLYKVEKEYSEKNSLAEVVGSTMIWASQYDQMMMWMKENQIDVTSTTPIEGASYNSDTERKTGSVETDKLNNVYDLLGNSREFTLEGCFNNARCSRRRVLRYRFCT